MGVEMYVQDGCSSCKSIREYLERRHTGIKVLSVDSIEGIPEMSKRVAVRVDLAYQHDETPLVYIDGEHQELDELKKKAFTVSIAERQDCDHCNADFLFG